MKFEITKLCADSLRSFSFDNFGIQIKSAHAHELVAAYFGYSSRAALLSDKQCPISNLNKAEFVVLTPGAFVSERRKDLIDLPVNLPYEIIEGVYLPLYSQKLIVVKVMPTLEYLALSMANVALKSKPFYFNGLKVLREGVVIDQYPEGVRLKVLREYFSPQHLLENEKGSIAVIDIFDLKRVAGYIGFTKASHSFFEADTLEVANQKMANESTSSVNSQLEDYKRIDKSLGISFPDWLSKQKRRDSPLGDLANKRNFEDTNSPWPSFDNLDDYKNYLLTTSSPRGSMAALESAWKSYKRYLHRMLAGNSVRLIKNPKQPVADQRRIEYVNKVIPIHYSNRDVERFSPGDKAWISYDGKKAMPVTVLEADERDYTVRIERPLKHSGDVVSLRLDEVRSTPQLACKNCVTS